jgi:hypothetical protein
MRKNILFSIVMAIGFIFFSFEITLLAEGDSSFTYDGLKIIVYALLGIPLIIFSFIGLFNNLNAKSSRVENDLFNNKQEKRSEEETKKIKENESKKNEISNNSNMIDTSALSEEDKELIKNYGMETFLRSRKNKVK